MLLGAMSCECFHCVDYRVVHSSNQTAEFLKSISGTVCPLCGLRAEEFWLVADSADIKKVRDGTGTWNLADDPTGEFARFGVRSDSSPRGSSAAADRLRGQLSASTDRRRKEMCQTITDVSKANVAMIVGLKAREAGQLGKARKAFEVCAGTGKAESFQAAYHLGDLDAAERNHSSAARWYERAAETPDANLRAVASVFLGVAYWKTGQLDAAERVFQRCADSGVSPAQGIAAHKLGVLRSEQNDRIGARAAYEFAVGLRDRLSSPDAALNLGAMEEDDGNWDRARDLWDYAHKSGPAETSRLAAFNLGRYWDHRGKDRKARTCYEIAQHCDDLSFASRARAILNSGGP